MYFDTLFDIIVRILKVEKSSNEFFEWTSIFNGFDKN